MIDSVRVVESLAISAPLGIRFRDVATGAFVGGGLNVTAYAPTRPHRVTPALVNSSGVYVFPRLPGLRSWENEDVQSWASLPAGRLFMVAVDDPEGRFLPCRFSVTAPARGLAMFACGSPLLAGVESPVSAAPAVPLFSGPARAAPGSMAAVRGQLWELAADRPAAWALVAVQPPQMPAAWGLADAQGQVALFLPYPAPVTPSVGSPLGSQAAPLWAQRWLLPVTVYYDAVPASPALSSPPGIEAGAAGGVALPDLCDLLQQGPAVLWRMRSPPAPLLEVELRYGEDAVLRSEGAGGEPLPVMFVGD